MRSDAAAEIALQAVGRYVDPRDRNRVHEAQTVHRRERSTDSFGRDDLLVVAKVADATHT